MPPAFVQQQQQQHIYGKVLKAEGHIYLPLKHILGNQGRETHSFPTLYLAEFRSIHTCSLPFFPHLSFLLFFLPLPNIWHLWAAILTDDLFPWGAKGSPTLKDVRHLGGRQVAWCYTTGPCSCHCCIATLTSLDIHTHLIPCKMADLVTIQQAQFKENKSWAV